MFEQSEEAALGELRVVEHLVRRLDGGAHDAEGLQLLENLPPGAVSQPRQQDGIELLGMLLSRCRRGETLVFRQLRAADGAQQAAEEALAHGDYQHETVLARHGPDQRTYGRAGLPLRRL